SSSLTGSYLAEGGLRADLSQILKWFLASLVCDTIVCWNEQTGRSLGIPVPASLGGCLSCSSGCGLTIGRRSALGGRRQTGPRLDHRLRGEKELQHGQTQSRYLPQAGL